ncbi:MAG TPA: hypothetical protein V6C86_06050 [Oculatellaceae cyanobacterium]
MSDAATNPNKVESKAPAVESKVDSTNHAADSRSHSWLADAAQAAWSATKGVGKVVAAVGSGIAEEVVEHPGTALAEVGLGLGAAVVTAELGIGLGAVAAGSLVAYGAYEAVKIAATEGVSAIPGHLTEAISEAKDGITHLADAARTVLSGKGDDATQSAALKTLDDAGRASAPLALGAIGGLASESVRTLAGAAIKGLEDILPPLSFEPAYATASGAVRVDAAAAAISKPVDSGIFKSAMTGMDGGEIPRATSNPLGKADDYTRQQHFIEGKTAVQGSIEPGVTTKLGEVLPRVGEILKNGGVEGYFKFTDIGGGWIEGVMTDGRSVGTKILYERGSKQFLTETVSGTSRIWDIK